MEGDAPINAQMLAGEGGHRDASNADQSQGLLRRRLAAEEKLETTGPALLALADFLLMLVVWAMAQPPAWVTKARETGERHYEASFCRLITTIAYADAVGMVAVLCVYQVKAVPVFAERVLAIVRVSVLVVTTCIGILVSVGISDGWREAVALYVVFEVSRAVMVLFCTGELKKFLLKNIEKVFGF